MRSTLSIFLLTLLLALPASAANQAGDVHFSTYAGRYSPQADVIHELDGALTARMDPALGFGGQFTLWLNSNVALAGSAFYAQTALTSTSAGDPVSIDSNIFLGGGRMVVGFGGAENRPGIVNLSAGVVMNKTTYSDLIESNAHPAGVVGLDLNIPLGEAVGFHLGVDDYIYDKWFEVGGVRTEDARQHDVVLFGGLTFYGGGRTR